MRRGRGSLDKCLKNLKLRERGWKREGTKEGKDRKTEGSETATCYGWQGGWLTSLWKSEVKGTRDQAEKAQLGAAHAPPLLFHKGQWQCSSPSPLMFLPIALLPA